MLVYKSFNPRAFKGIDKSKLSVYWKANSKAWVTAELFKDEQINDESLFDIAVNEANNSKSETTACHTLCG